MVCSRYGCGALGTADTEMGVMCREHASPLLFEVQMPRPLRGERPEFFLPWEFIREHDRQARTNHGGQTLARLSERGGLSPSETLAVLRDREWSHIDHDVAVAEIRRMLAEWTRRDAA